MSDVPAAVPPPPPPPPAPPPAEEGSHSLSSRVRGLSCPNCGGALEVDAGLRVVTCPYCATPLLAVSEIGVRRLAVEPRVEAAKARELARGWLATGISKEPKLRREAEIGEAFLSFLPFFRVEADCVGFALGTELRRRTTGVGKSRRVRTYEVDVERSVQKSFDRTYPALNVAEWGVRKVDLRGDPLVAYDPDALARRGMVFPPTGSEGAVLEAALEQFRREADPGRGLKRTRFRFLEVLRERLTVIYYPLWVVRYRFRERSYQVLVDGEDGSIAFGKAPGNDFYRALAMVATQAAALYVGTTLLQVWRGGWEAFAVVGAGMLLLLAWGWKKFRYGGVVIEGTGTAEEPGLGVSIRDLASADGRQEVVRELVAGRLPGLLGPPGRRR